MHGAQTGRWCAAPSPGEPHVTRATLPSLLRARPGYLRRTRAGDKKHTSVARSWRRRVAPLNGPHFARAAFPEFLGGRALAATRTLQRCRARERALERDGHTVPLRRVAVCALAIARMRQGRHARVRARERGGRRPRLGRARRRHPPCARARAPEEARWRPRLRGRRPRAVLWPSAPPLLSLPPPQCTRVHFAHHHFHSVPAC